MAKKSARKIHAKKPIKRTVEKEKVPTPKAPKPTLQELKRQVKGTWPEVKNLADSRRKELAALVERGDAELFKECQEIWAKRSKERHDEWLRGNSKSAQTIKQKRGT